jgi:dienelactone hydrolase
MVSQITWEAMRAVCRALICVAFAVTGCAILPNAADAADIEHVSFASITPLGPLTISRKLEAGKTHVVVTADIYLPDGAAKPMPAMLVMHGSGGMEYDGEDVRAWAARLNSWGVAALVIDSFTPRGVNETYTSQGRVPEWANLADAFEGLKLLASDSRFDRGHIGVMGFSRGGQVAAWTALESLRKGLIDDDLHFAVHIPFYAYCGTAYQDQATDKMPMLFLHGEADNYTPIPPCRDYADWFRSMGNAVIFVGYPHAYHDFDRPSGSVTFDRRAEVYADCDVRYDIPAGRYLRVNHDDHPTQDRAEIAAYLKSCMTHGANVGPDPAARDDAIGRVHAFLVENLRAH